MKYGELETMDDYDQFEHDGSVEYDIEVDNEFEFDFEVGDYVNE